MGRQKLPRGLCQGSTSLACMQTAASTKRLLIDYDEIRRNPLQTVTAAPLDDDIYCWHATLLGIDSSPYAGSIFHIELKFPPSYPAEPPSARVLTPIPHPHVHGDKICLDLLSDYNSYFQRSAVAGSYHTGWSPAYSVLSILLQLQAFLLEVDDEHSDDEDEDEAHGSHQLESILVQIPGAIRASRSFACSRCPHKAPDTLWPPVVQRSILSVSTDAHSDSLVCFHSKRSFRDDCLGLGLRIERNNSGRIKRLYTGLDIVSWTAFNTMGVRSGVLSNNDQWTHWIPLWLNDEHGKRALPLFKRVACFIFNSPDGVFRAEYGFEIVQKLMNHFIVQIMKGDVYASERALEGYCYFHRWLYVFAKEYPDTLAKKVRVMADFIHHREKRHKRFVPDVGEFITLISLDIEFNWEDAKHAYLEECYARNALWIVRANAQLGRTTPDPAIDRTRPELTFSTNQVSMKLCVFHVYFLQYVGRPEGMSGAQICEMYDARLGRPSRAMRVQWQASLQDILKIGSWNEYFAWIGEPPMRRDELNDFLRRQMANSPYVPKDSNRDRNRRRNR